MRIAHYRISAAASAIEARLSKHAAQSAADSFSFLGLGVGLGRDFCPKKKSLFHIKLRDSSESLTRKRSWQLLGNGSLSLRPAAGDTNYITSKLVLTYLLNISFLKKWIFIWDLQTKSDYSMSLLEPSKYLHNV